MFSSDSYNSVLISNNSRKIALVCQCDLWQSSWFNSASTPYRAMDFCFANSLSKHLYLCYWAILWCFKASSFNFQKHTEICRVLGVRSTLPMQSSVTHTVGEGALWDWFPAFELSVAYCGGKGTAELAMSDPIDSKRWYKRKRTGLVPVFVVHLA